MSGLLNRHVGSTAAGANLDGAPIGFRVTGDAAWDSHSDDWAMFSDAGNAMVGRMVREVRYRTRNLVAESDVLAWIKVTAERIERAGHREVWDTMVRETVAYALDDAWQEAYGHGFPVGSWSQFGKGSQS